MINPLKSLAIRHGTDKYGPHNYVDIYWKHLAQLRQMPVRLLEIGIGGYKDPADGGGSLAMWRDFFPNAIIVGIDVFEKQLDYGPRVIIEQGSQTDAEFLTAVSAKHGPFDVVIDDGSHMMEDVISSFNILFPLLRDQGMYFVEDTQTSFFEEFGGGLDQHERTIVGFFADLFQDQDYMEKLVRFPHANVSSFSPKIECIHRYHNIIVIEKGRNEFPSNFGLHLASDEMIDEIVSDLTIERGKPDRNRLSVLFDFLFAAGRYDRAETVLMSLSRIKPISSAYRDRFERFKAIER